MIDLTAITTPFGLLDRETQEALKAHGGPWEVYTHLAGWEKTVGIPIWAKGNTYRVKPAPPKPREWWLCAKDETHITIVRCDPPADGEFGLVVHVREVLPE
jgi:hypothetical protein